MTDLTDEQREQAVRLGLKIGPTHAVWPIDAYALLRLLDAERARAQVAETKLAQLVARDENA